MSQSRWQWIPVSLVASGVLLVGIAAVVNRTQLGWWGLELFVACALALAALFWFRRRMTAAELEIEQARAALQAGREQLATQREQLDEIRTQVEKQFESEAIRLERRERELSDRLLAYHEWMEFPKPQPQPLDLAQRAAPVTDLAQLAKKDRQMMELLRVETKVLYENIKTNKYSHEGKFDARPLRDDLYVLIGHVARIYQPAVEQPLLETNMALVIRAASRACLHFLVIIDELPLNVKDYNFNSLYTYVRNAVNAYSMYRSAEPYWPYMNTAYYISRFALGANPLTLGAWWFVGALGARGAKALAKHVVDRQALALLSDVVRVVGYEVAGIYGGDFRHRDANWIYGAELSEMVSQFPLSRESLSHGLKEIGALQLRNEYDRIFLYRCLASHVTARPQQYRPAEFLTMEERLAIAARLERFLETFVHGKSHDRLASWKTGVEGRLGIRLALAQATAPTNLTVQAQIEDAVRSLASFLIGVKELEPSELALLSQHSQLLAELPGGEQQALIARLQDDPPFFFEHPDLDPASDLVQKYLEDLATLHVRTRPRDLQVEDSLVGVAAYLRRKPDEMRQLIKQRLKTYFAERLPADAPLRRVPGAVARVALDLLNPDENARFIYGNIALEWPPGIAGPQYDKQNLWLLGAGSRLILVLVADAPQLLWRGEGTVRAELGRGFLNSSCRLTGGVWLPDPQQPPPAIRIGSTLVTNFGDLFKPLLKMIEPAQSDLPLLEGKVDK